MNAFSRLFATVTLGVLALPVVVFADVPVRSCCAVLNSQTSTVSKCYQFIDVLPGNPSEAEQVTMRDYQQYSCSNVPQQFADHQGKTSRLIRNDVDNSGVCGTALSIACPTRQGNYVVGSQQVHARCQTASDCFSATNYLCQNNFCKLKEGQPCAGDNGLPINCADGLLCRTTFEGSKCLTPEADVSAPAGAAAGGSASQEPAPFVPVVPELGVPIPGFSFTSATEVDGVVSVPYLSQYINAIYRYMTAIILTVAIVMIVIGGFKYLLAATPLAVKDGKKTITDALIGMMLVLGAYVILNSVNPTLLSLKTLEFARIDPVEFELFLSPPGVENHGLASSGGGNVGESTRRALQDPVYDEIFKKYAGCAGVDYRVLKAMSFLESRYNPTVINSFGYTGLFQAKDDTCGCLDNYGVNYRGRLTDPEINTMCGVMCHIKPAAERIRRNCNTNVDAARATLLIYFSHNSGSGAFGRLTSQFRGGICTADLQTLQNSETARVLAWCATEHGRTRERWDTPALCEEHYPNYDGRLLQTSSRVASYASALGVTVPFVTNNTPCPLTAR